MQPTDRGGRGRRRWLRSCTTKPNPYTKWPELFPVLTRSILDAAESSGARLVFSDNLYAYRPVDGPLREDLPAMAQGRKGRTVSRWPPRSSLRTARVGCGL